MSKILHFPEERQVRNNLVKSKDTLKELYSSLELCYSTIEKLEERIKEEETTYNGFFTKYVNATGFDNVEIEFLEYVSGDIHINVDTGEISLSEEESLQKILDQLNARDEDKE